MFSLELLSRHGTLLVKLNLSLLFLPWLFVYVRVLGGALGRYVQRKLSGLKIFEEPSVSVRESLRAGIAICEQWVVACEHLTGQVWKS